MHQDTEDLMASSKQCLINAVAIRATNPSLGVTSPEGPLSASLGQLLMETQFGLSSMTTFWVHHGLLLHCVLHRGFQQSLSQIGFCRLTSFTASRTTGPRELSLWPDPKAPAPGVGLSAPSQASVWAGMLLAPLPSWVTAPVFCVETLAFSFSGALHLPIRLRWNHLLRVSHGH